MHISFIKCACMCFFQDSAAYTALWKETCKKSSGDEGSGFLNSITSSSKEGFQVITVPFNNIENVVDPTTGFIRHTILIVHSTSKAFNDGTKLPLLRVSLKSQKVVDGPQDVLGVFTPYRSPLLDVILADAKFGDNFFTLGSHSLSKESIPQQYMQKDFQKWQNLVIGFFIITITISMYYAVTYTHVFSNLPYLIISLGIRLPLAMVGLMTGAQLYFWACLLQAIGYFQKASVYSATRQKRQRTFWILYDFQTKTPNAAEVGCFIFVLVSLVLYILHVAFWLPVISASGAKDKLAFSLYENYKLHQKGGAFFQVERKLLTNFFEIFLAVDGIFSLLVATFHILMFGYCSMVNNRGYQKV